MSSTGSSSDFSASSSAISARMRSASAFQVGHRLRGGGQVGLGGVELPAGGADGIRGGGGRRFGGRLVGARLVQRRGGGVDGVARGGNLRLGGVDVRLRRDHVDVVLQGRGEVRLGASQRVECVVDGVQGVEASRSASSASSASTALGKPTRPARSASCGSGSCARTSAGNRSPRPTRTPDSATVAPLAARVGSTVESTPDASTVAASDGADVDRFLVSASTREVAVAASAVTA